MVPPDTYSLVITDEEGITHGKANNYVPEKQEYVTFTIPEEIDSCFSCLFVPESAETLDYKIAAPNVSLII